MEEERDTPSQLVAALSELSAEDRALAESQRICPVTKMPLGSMGTPPKVDVNGTPVFICCEGCREGLLKEPAKYLAILAARPAADDPGHDAAQPDLPPIGDTADDGARPRTCRRTSLLAASDRKSVAVTEALARLSPVGSFAGGKAAVLSRVRHAARFDGYADQSQRQRSACIHLLRRVPRQPACRTGKVPRETSAGGDPMIKKILDFCIRERLIVLIAIVGVVGYGWYATKQVPLDAIPNVGENQVIVLTEWMGRSPKDMEDQITYPLSVALQAVPGAKSVRGKSMFGFSFVQVTFADSVDFYWARSRVAEQLTTVSGSLPDGVTPTLAPDATALGQIYYYVLEPPAGMDLAELRSKQDFFIKYALQSVDGVAEVASIGGYERQYQIEVDPGQAALPQHSAEHGHRRGQGIEHRRRSQDGRSRAAWSISSAARASSARAKPNRKRCSRSKTRSC